jgi:hypothetical protein
MDRIEADAENVFHEALLRLGRRGQKRPGKHGRNRGTPRETLVEKTRSSGWYSVYSLVGIWLSFAANLHSSRTPAVLDPPRAALPGATVASAGAF